MSARHATKNAILTYLRTVKDERTTQRIGEYMTQMHRVNYRATMAQLARLAKAGEIIRVDKGRYQAV